MKFRDDLVPIKRPHFKLKNNSLYFLISRRPYCHLNDEEKAVWNSISGTHTIDELGIISPNAINIIRKFWKNRTVELIPSKLPSNRRKILIIEPHMDDAILSVGGLMWQKREECEFFVVSVVGRSNFTSYYRLNREYFDTEKISNLRNCESSIAMKVIGGNNNTLNAIDAPLRYKADHWTVDWYNQHRRSVSAYVNHSMTDNEVESWQKPIARTLDNTDAEEIWIPLGIGTSADHEAVRNACIWSLMKIPNILKHKKIFFYHEVPYAINFPSHTEEILKSLRISGGSFLPIENDIENELEPKKRLISIYASQFKMSYMGPKVEASAELLSPKNKKYGERLIQVVRLPDKISQLDLYVNKFHIIKTSNILPEWLNKSIQIKTITILSPMGFGRWSQDIRTILESLPNSKLELYISSDAATETDRFKNSRVKVLPVKGNSFSWILQIVKLIVCHPTSIIIFTGSQYSKYQQFLKLAFQFSNPLVCNKPDDLARAIKRSRMIGNPHAQSFIKT
jgi:hypothetical protein